MQKCLKKAGLSQPKKNDVLVPSDSPSPMAEFKGVDFEGFVAMDNEVEIANKPDPDGIFQSILTEVQTGITVHEQLVTLKKQGTMPQKLRRQKKRLLGI